MIKLKNGIIPQLGTFLNNDNSYVEISVPDEKNVKIVKAKLKLQVKEFTDSENKGMPVKFEYVKDNLDQDGWDNVDYLRNLNVNDYIYIDFTDELQHTINNNGSAVKLFFDCSTSTIKFVEESKVVDVEAISLTEYQSNASYNNINFGSAGNGKVNLLTGEFSLNHLDLSVRNNSLTCSIIHNYNNTRKSSLNIFDDDKFNTHCGYGWNLNIQQYLKKLSKESTSADQLRFEYIDANGKSQIIEEKYYYIDEDNNKIFKSPKSLEVDLDGNLVYNLGSTENPIYTKIYTILESSTGFKLISSIKDFLGSDLVDFEPEELSNIRLQIEQLETYISSGKTNIINSEKQLCLLVLSKYNSMKTLNLLETDTSDYKAVTYDNFNEALNNTFDEEDKIYIYLCKTLASSIKKLVEDLNVYVKDNSFSLDLESIDAQLESTYENLLQTKETLSKYEDQLKKLKHQQELYELQVPVHYLYSDDNIIYGFGKTSDESVFRLVYITDMYENSIVINYEDLDSNKIINIVDSSNNIILFNYNKDNLLESIVDARDKITSFIYDNSRRLLMIKNNDEIACHYSYDVGNLIFVVNNTGKGTFITYDSNKVVKIQEFSLIDSIKDNINFKDNLSLEFEENLNILPYFIENAYVNFEYYNCKTTKISDKDKTITYIFDSHGNLVYCYEENNSEQAPTLFSNSKEFKYKQDLKSDTISIIPYSHNYLRNSPNLYIGSFETSSCYNISTPSYTYTTPSKTTLTATPTSTLMKEYSVNEYDILKINAEKIRNLVLLGWAKANSAFVKNNDDIDVFDEETSNINYPSYVLERKFELRVNVKYKNDTNVVTISKQFDWMNDQMQSNFLSFKLENKEVESITCYIDYSYNTNEIEFYDLELYEGSWETNNYNDEKLLISSKTEKSTTNYEYDDNHNLIKEILQYNNKEYITTYEYNKNNKLLKTISYNGIVTENVYNNAGVVIKTFTYHKDDPTSKYVEESILDEKGNETSSLNELGEKISTYEYINNSNLISKTIDENGNKVAFGYNSNDTMNSMTTTVDGEENTNLYKYVQSVLTSLTHNNFAIKFEYDNQCRQNKVIIANEEYLSKSYAENEETTTLASGEIYKHTFNDKEDNIYFNEQLLIKNIYNDYGTLTKTEDYSNNVKHSTHYFFNKYGKQTGKTTEQHDIQLTFEDILNNDTQNVESSSISIGDKSLNYSFEYAQDLDSKLNKVTLPTGDVQKITYDKLGRTTAVTFNNKVKQYHYLKSGDHCSNLISSVWYGENNKIKDNVKYKYDNKGNIVEIRENGNLVNRYKYDALSRLIREDNKHLNKTTTYEYDAGGNIVDKKEYGFTLQSVEEIEPINVDNYVYSATGWKDQLLSYNGETIEYDKLGNPTTYRNKTFNWSHGRQLDSIENIASYKYNANGIRTSKTVNTTTTKFYLNNNKIIAQDNGNLLYFHYGLDGIVGFTLDIPGLPTEEYTYKKNIQGDIIGIYNADNVLFCKYVYDAWGKQTCYVLRNDGEYVDFDPNLSYSNISSNYILVANLNPFRYRSYYYDTETGLYYLNSRYYDPETGRFINADDISVLSSLAEEFNGLNLYAYCFNNPVNDIDENGNWSWKKFWKAVAVVAVMAVVVTITVVTAGTGSLVGGAIIAGTLAAGANVFNQAIIQNKSFREVDWIDVGISFVSTSLSTLIPGSSFNSILLQSFTSASITSILNKVFYNESVNWGEVAFNTFINLGANYATIGLDKVTNRLLGKLVISKMIKGSSSERLGLYKDMSFGSHLINEFFVNLFITRNGG